MHVSHPMRTSCCHDAAQPVDLLLKACTGCWHVLLVCSLGNANKIMYVFASAVRSCKAAVISACCDRRCQWLLLSVPFVAAVKLVQAAYHHTHTVEPCWVSSMAGSAAAPWIYIATHICLPILHKLTDNTDWHQVTLVAVSGGHTMWYRDTLEAEGTPVYLTRFMTAGWQVACGRFRLLLQHRQGLTNNNP